MVTGVSVHKNNIIRNYIINMYSVFADDILCRAKILVQLHEGNVHIAENGVGF